MKIAIAGGTGLVGTLVVELAEAAGHQVVVLARGRGSTWSAVTASPLLSTAWPRSST
jgi:uncharacterized protein YbjT (DUF2867 family)